VKYNHNVLLILLMAVVALTVFGVSFKIGEMIFDVYKQSGKDSSQNHEAKNNRETPTLAVVPNAVPPVAGEGQSGVKGAAPVKKEEPAVAQTGKDGNPAIEKEMAGPVPKAVLMAVQKKNEQKPPVEKPLAQPSLEKVSPATSFSTRKVTAAQTGSAVIVTAVVNIRSEPNIKSRIASRSKKGDNLEILGDSGDWLHVQLSSGSTGWVLRTLTSAASPAEKVVAPFAGSERPMAATEPKRTAPIPDTKPVAIATAVNPVAKAQKPMADNNAVAKKVPGTIREYQVIVGSCLIRANADVLIGELKENNYEPVVILAETPKGQMYRVVVGSYLSSGLAKVKMTELKKLGFHPFVVMEGPSGKPGRTKRGESGVERSGKLPDGRRKPLARNDDSIVNAILPYHQE
jgi:hypothetical protein